MEKHRKKKLVTCIDCGTTWSIRTDRRSSRCRECGVKWFNKIRPILNGPQNSHWKGGAKICRKNRMLNNKKWAFEYKGGKCSVCGNKDLILPCYNFHHTQSKDKNIQYFMKCNSDKLKIELDKCILVCHHCHITLHYNNGTFGRKGLGI